MRLEAGLPDDRRKDFNTMAENGLDRVPIVFDIVVRSAKPLDVRWWAHQDSNLEPRDYESRALTIEL